MGCASSSPLVTGAHNVADAAKNGVSDAVQAGEGVMHEIGENISDAAEHVKDTMVGAVQSVGQGIESVFSDKKEEKKIMEVAPITNTSTDDGGNLLNDTNLYKYIPLKEPLNTSVSQLGNLKEIATNNADKLTSEAHQMADDILQETDNLMDDTQIGVDKIKNMTNDMLNNHGSPDHSIDSLKTSTPEPEIVNAETLGDAMKSTSPEPMSDLQIVDMDDNPTDGTNNNEQNSEPIQTTQTDLNPANLLNTIPSNPLILKVQLSPSIVPSDTIPLDDSESVQPNINQRETVDDECPSMPITTADDDDDNDEMEPTAWEKLADAIVKLPVHRSPKQITSFVSPLKAASADNLLTLDV